MNIKKGTRDIIDAMTTDATPKLNTLNNIIVNGIYDIIIIILKMNWRKIFPEPFKKYM